MDAPPNYKQLAQDQKSLEKLNYFKVNNFLRVFGYSSDFNGITDFVVH